MEAATLTRSALEDFRRPFTPEAIRWKIQSTWKDNGGATLIGYIDARLVIERLNHVTPIWEDQYVLLGDNRAECSLTVCGVTRRDVGVGQGMTPDVVTKAMYSDALKRAAVKFGIGVSLYALPSIMLRVGPKDSELRARNNKPIVDDRTVAALGKGYGKWLGTKDAKGPGWEMFGGPLDHGDVAGAMGDPDLIPAPPGVTAAVGNGTDEGTGAELPPEVEHVIARARAMGHAGYANRTQVELAVVERPDAVVKDWLVKADQDLTAFAAEKAKGAEVVDAVEVDREDLQQRMDDIGTEDPS